MSANSTKGIPFPSHRGNILDRTSAKPEANPLSENQVEVNRLVGSAISTATDTKVMASLFTAGMAGRLIRLGALSASGNSALPFVRQGASHLAALSGESAVFAGMERRFAAWEGHSPTQTFQMDWARAAINLGSIKLIGGAAKGQNLILQHLLVDAGMVGGNHLGFAFGVTERPEGNLARQLIQAEGVNLGMKGSLALLHGFSPRLHGMERSVDLALKSQEPNLIFQGEWSPLLRSAADGLGMPVSKPSKFEAPKGPDRFAMSAQNGEKEGASPMQESYAIAGAIVREGMDPEARGRLERMDEKDLIVVNGSYDHIDRVLKALGVPFTEANQFDITPRLLEGAQFVFVNCASVFPEPQARVLGRFVEAGGWMMTTDWALKNVLEVAFRDARGNPMYVKHNGWETGGKKPAGQSHELVGINEYKKDEPMIANYWGNGEPQWWLEPSSYPIEILAKGHVEVLARSEELGKRYGADPVIIRFPHGKGGVIHMISHFFLQQGGAKLGEADSEASAYATSLGASPELIEKIRKTQGKTGVTAGTMRSAASSLGFVAGAITGFGKEGKAPRPNPRPRPVTTIHVPQVDKHPERIGKPKESSPPVGGPVPVPNVPGVRPRPATWIHVPQVDKKEASPPAGGPAVVPNVPAAVVPPGPLPATKLAGASSIGEMMGVPLASSVKVVRQAGHPRVLSWRPEARKANILMDANGLIVESGVKNPEWIWENGLWAYRMPLEKDWTVLGREGDSQLTDLRTPPGISRVHAGIRRFSQEGNTGYVIYALRGDVGVKRGDEHHYLQGNLSYKAPGQEGEHMWLLPGDQVMLGADMVFIFQPPS